MTRGPSRLALGGGRAVDGSMRMRATGLSVRSIGSEAENVSHVREGTLGRLGFRGGRVEEENVFQALGHWGGVGFGVESLERCPNFLALRRGLPSRVAVGAGDGLSAGGADGGC